MNIFAIIGLLILSSCETLNSEGENVQVIDIEKNAIVLEKTEGELKARGCKYIDSIKVPEPWGTTGSKSAMEIALRNKTS